MRVVPSDVVEQIERLFPNTKFDLSKKLQFFMGHRSFFSVILELVDLIPEELITFGTDDFSAYQTAIASMRSQIGVWDMQGDQSFDTTPGYSTDPVTLLHSLLSKCPDEAAASSTAGLDFISDEIQRQILRIDKSDADRALSNGEWKAATVLAGSIIEALLLWAIFKRAADIPGAVGVLQKRNVNLPRANRAPEEWHLHEFIEVSAELKIIGDTTAAQCRLAKGFRNLIHPGAEIRRAERCGRPEALGSAAALEHVIRDLSSRS